MKAASLARVRIAVNRVMIWARQGYHPEPAVTAYKNPFKDADMNSEAKMIPNQGMIWTNRTVLKVAKLMDFEVSPIHMPNQPSAAILPSVARPDRADVNAAADQSPACW